MLYRKFGRTNEEVSTLGFGCMRLPILPGGDPQNIDEEKATQLIHTAIDNGVNYLDTAYPYHGAGMTKPGNSEPFVGKILKNGYREKVKIATKLPSWLIQSREDMDKYLDEQLKRLECGYIDFYLIHGLNKIFWPNVKEKGCVDFLDSALKDGRIKHAGFSYHDNHDLFINIVDAYDWEFCQIQYNYFDIEFQAGVKGLKYAADKGLGIAIMEPLRGGGLASNIPHEGLKLLQSINKDRSPAEWAMRWLLNQAEISVVLSGMNAMEQLEENLNTFSAAGVGNLSEKENQALSQVKQMIKDKTKVPCTGCEYCMPCPSGVNIARCFALYNDYFMFDDLATAKVFYAFSLKPDHGASACVECGTCEEHCPQHISIIEELKDVAVTLED